MSFANRTIDISANCIIGTIGAVRSSPPPYGKSAGGVGAASGGDGCCGALVSFANRTIDIIANCIIGTIGAVRSSPPPYGKSAGVVGAASGGDGCWGVLVRSQDYSRRLADIAP
ncbi:hypothetical protein EH243_06915 [Amphritea opalescens]|uniref:Uncharacterized protein n=1 Tax=Amphritea opalescens TaxID=2490544 RepID=A0A430KS29_9GAMM|nr:hypothetical protein [Amphritea opalescens]RTE66319.1 hypothetical protein EH243_06915 [Amphritea opalescens]